MTEAALEDSALSAADRCALLSHPLYIEPDAVNATAIRDQIRRAEAPSELDPAVFGYLAEHDLYRC